MSTRCILIMFVGVSVFAGCGEAPDAKFVLNKRTLALSPEARVPVEEMLRDNFGTPIKMVAWKRLPIEFGGIEGKVVAVNIDENPSSFQVEMSGDVGDIAGYDELYWHSGGYAGNTLRVESYDVESRVVTLFDKLEAPPKQGDTFQLKAGHILKDGRRLYMTHCVHCHGVSGDGNGPTAKYLNPLPRDYRLGLFKFTSTVQLGKPGDKARRDDLNRIIRNGIPGTYMPSFMLLEDDELKAIVEYVRWLAMRGELENKLDNSLSDSYSQSALKERLEGGETKDEIFATLAEDASDGLEQGSEEIAMSWSTAEEDQSVVRPEKNRPGIESDPDSIARGRALFLSAKAKCVTCHGSQGKGDGPNTEDLQKKLDGSLEDKPGLYDDWGNPSKPRDLTTGIFRGGRRPIDIYRRIRAGIKGTKMPPFPADVLNDAEVWDLVNYVLHIPQLESGTLHAAEGKKVAAESHGGH